MNFDEYRNKLWKAGNFGGTANYAPSNQLKEVPLTVPHPLFQVCLKPPFFRSGKCPPAVVPSISADGGLTLGEHGMSVLVRKRLDIFLLLFVGLVGGLLPVP